MKRLLLIGLLVCSWLAGPAYAEDLLMFRSKQTFPEAMLALQGSIVEHGYIVSRVQRVDIGLTKSGYKTDKYRIVFFGKPSEVNAIKFAEPELIPYLPLKIAIFAEGQETMLVAANPVQYASFVRNTNIADILKRWENDLRSIFNDVQ
ncbi:DUF302 domain-containing protein [Sulfuriflexus mobilis]|uniref:DUF302 domain-containing protein n=1 Tax=Sulfuriflexus mobilis TaxID=1811807 RepID=UPI000F819F0F|nr:DUF302 domain-containing protein [Sulfuriflexus mobilis]